METLCHPRLDLVAVRVVSPLVRRGRIAVRLRFPYGTGRATAADWTRPEAHETVLVRRAPHSADLARRLDDDGYHVRLAWAPAGRLAEEAKHAYVLEPAGDGEALEAVVGFSPLRSRSRSPASRTPAGPHGSTGTASGRRAGPSISRKAATPAGASWSAGSCSRSTSPRSSARAGTRRRRPGSPSTAGRASSTSRCTGGTPRTSLSGAASSSWSGASATTTRSCRGRGRPRGARATPARGGPR